jgi:hypothetical protein
VEEVVWIVLCLDLLEAGELRVAESALDVRLLVTA